MTGRGDHLQTPALLERELGGEAIDLSAAHLPQMSIGEEVVVDYVSMSLSFRTHLVALLRHIMMPAYQHLGTSIP